MGFLSDTFGGIGEVFEDAWDTIDVVAEPVIDIYTQGLYSDLAAYDHANQPGAPKPFQPAIFQTMTGGTVGGGPAYSDSRGVSGEWISLGGGAVVPVAAVLPHVGAAAAAAGRWALKKFGKSDALLSGNGLKIKASEAWRFIQKWGTDKGPQVLAGALGWTVPALMAVLMDSGQITRKRRRRRGVSASNIRTAKRVIRFARSLSAQLGSVGGYRRRASRGRWGRGDGVQVVRAG